MSKFAQVRNGKVVATQQGAKPSEGNWLPVVIKWTKKPSVFHLPASNLPTYKVLLTEVEEHLEWTLPPLIDLHQQQFQRIASERWDKEQAGFEYNGMMIPATATAQVKIPNMPKSIKSFKIADGKFITTEDTQPLKDKLVAFVQGGYEWEDAECTKVKECLTHAVLEELLYPVT